MTRQFVLVLAAAAFLAGPDRLSAQVAAPPADSLALAWQKFADTSPQVRETRHKEAVAVTHDWLRGYLDEDGTPRRSLVVVLVRSHYNHLNQDPFGIHQPDQRWLGNDQILPRALADLDRACRLDPTFLPARVGLGILYYQAGRLRDAIRHLEFARSVIAAAATDDAPTGAAIDLECCAFLGWCYRELGAWDEGLAVVEQGLGHRATNGTLLVLKGLLLAGAGRVTEANAVAERLPPLNVPHAVPTDRGFVRRPSGFAADWIRSQAQLSSGRPELARAIITKNLEDKFDWIAMPFARQYWNDVGLVFELTAPDDAATSYDQAYRTHNLFMCIPISGGTMKPIYAGLPDGGLPFHMTFDRFYLVGSPFAYVAHQLTAMEENWATPAGEEARGRALDMVGSLAARGIRRDFCHAVRGRIALRDGDLARAETELLAARNAGVRDPDISLMLAQISLKTGNQAAAEGYFREVVASSPGTAHAWQGLGISLAETGRFDLALEAMNKALDCDSRSVAGWYNRGMILYKYGRYDDAERDLLQARELAPDRPEIVVMLQAVSLARRGRPR